MKKQRQYAREHRPEAKVGPSPTLEVSEGPVMAPPVMDGGDSMQLTADHSAPVVQRQTGPGEDDPRTVGNFIELLKKIEAAHPDAGPEEIAGRLAMTSQYNGVKFQDMMGISGKGYEAFAPVEGMLSQEDLDSLTSMMDHSGDTLATETGIAVGQDGNYSALGHAVTGLVSGMNPNEEYNPLAEGVDDKIGFGGGLASGLIGNPTFDNVMGMTLAGDLGQTGVMKSEELMDKHSEITRRGTKTDFDAMRAERDQTTFVGDGTEATDAEMRGDVDGINLANRWQATEGDEERPSVSDMFSSYYGEMGDDPGMRYDEFDENVTREELTDQSVKFADNYELRNLDSGETNFNLDSETGTRKAVDQFYDFAEKDRVKDPAAEGEGAEGDKESFPDEKKPTGIGETEDPADKELAPIDNGPTNSGESSIKKKKKVGEEESTMHPTVQ